MPLKKEYYMKNPSLRKFHLFSCLGLLVASFYPLYMGVRVIVDMIADGRVMKENYPKYIIPYTPICLALLVGVLLIPLLRKYLKRFALPVGTAVSAAVFFATELLLERKVVVAASESFVILKDWQMYMCALPSLEWGNTVNGYRELTPVEILMGEYDPAFKLHFYMISLVLILSVLNCFYGFAGMIAARDHTRRRALVLQSVSSGGFLGLCILACFTAFGRNGSLHVSPLSAGLMTAFFIILGLVGGIYAGSLLLGKPGVLSVAVPAMVSIALTGLMYVGEMILLHGHLYILGSGFLFESLPVIVLSPFDLLVILASGALTAALFTYLNRRPNATQNTGKELTM